MQSGVDLNALLRLLPYVVTVLDRDCRHLFINRTVTGHRPEYYIGKTHAELGMGPELVTLWRQFVAEILDTQQSGSMVVDYRIGKEVKTFETIGVPFDEDGETIIAVSRHITACPLGRCVELENLLKIWTDRHKIDLNGIEKTLGDNGRVPVEVIGTAYLAP